MADADAIPDVALPLIWREYALSSRAESRRIFEPAPLRRAWGMLFCADQRAAHWTALGDPKFVRAVLAAERRFGLSARRQRPPSPALAPPPSGKGELVGEFPLDDFRPHWLARGWPDEWQGLGQIEVWPWSAMSRADA